MPLEDVLDDHWPLREHCVALGARVAGDEHVTEHDVDRQVGLGGREVITNVTETHIV